MTAAQRLALVLADVAERKGTADPAEIEALVDALDDDTGLDDFFAALARELRRRNVAVPPAAELPASVAPLLAAARAAFDGPAPDLERVARQLDAPARARRDAELRTEIREHAAKSVAEALRRRGLVPAADVPGDDDDH